MLEILNGTIAVTAVAHNPSILHPSFLETQHIVPEGWELAEPPLCTPAMSLVRYKNGVVINVDLQKLQIVENSPPASLQDAAIPEIVRKYTATLPFVRYRGIGINFNGLVETEDAKALLMNFLAKGPWHQGDLQAEALGVRFVYSALGSRLRIAFDGGAVGGGDKPRKGVVVAANYHFSLNDKGVEGIASAVGRFAELGAHYKATVETILQQKESHASS